MCGPTFMTQLFCRQKVIVSPAPRNLLSNHVNCHLHGLLYGNKKKERTVLGNLLGHFYDKVKFSFKVQNCSSIPSKAPSFPHHLQNDSKMFLDWEFPRLKWGLIHLSLSLALPLANTTWQIPNSSSSQKVEWDNRKLEQGEIRFRKSNKPKASLSCFHN